MSTLLNAQSLRDRLLFAIPKKGRLYEKCLELLSGADIQFKRAHRLDVALVQNLPIALVFLPAADIPRFVAHGNVDLGITGQDMVAEAGHEVQSLIKEIVELGFGKCKLQVQVPEKVDETAASEEGQARKPFETVEELVGRKIATSFDFLAGTYFKELDAKVNEKRKADGLDPLPATQIEYLGGSVEAACALGVADGIVDLVESGETMRACGLHPISTLLSSQAVLIKSATPHPRLAATKSFTLAGNVTPSRPNANGTNDSASALLDLITSRIRGVIAADKYVLCQYNVQGNDLDGILKITPGRRAPTVSPLREDGWSAVSVMVLKNQLAEVMDKLEVAGAEDILVTNLYNCRV
ncbi:ATP phosphoribosyltransferase (ATP-PRTase) (ATP-PRT) [Tilletia horrida]|uniref:ATP phosphoribosyltransferase n=1 Tax=Tilletia horrida TaxID=155126 RepID=A0AAN6JV32_9BASI|nr:ATP phosphoribosyltransferase (ATP-PRTase) (ATP-PRT) [Tilletia horrida]KAK0559928.1 ATP phosphoribosyltransferase (ATP-PRTase) (ATP-PRT) [Tilletia horrida]